MNPISCPTSEDLSSWLDDQFDASQQVEIGSHVDSCDQCQGKLEHLTCRQAYAVRALGGRPLRRFIPTDCLPWPRKPSTRPHSCSRRPASPSRRRPLLFGALRLKQEIPSDGDITEFGAATSIDAPDAGLRRRCRRPSLATEPAAVCDRPERWSAIPSYDVLEVIREGGMSVVYKARQRGLNRLVALKMIRGKEWSRGDHLVRLRIEAEAVARLRHPNIVQIHEIGEVDGQPFLSLEFLEGGNSRRPTLG